MNTKILVVDDNADLLQIAQIILKAQGYDVFTATSVDEAERKIKIHQPVLILLDVCICEKDDGRVYCKALKDDAATKGIRVILMSGNEYDGEELADADAFLQKPFDFTDFTGQVSHQIRAVQHLPIAV